MGQFAKGRAETIGSLQQLRLTDVNRAYFYDPSRRPVFLHLPEDDSGHVMCGRPSVSTYGTMNAAANWDEKHESHFIANGFLRG